MAPLCKGSCHACVTEGLSTQRAAGVVSPYIRFFGRAAGVVSPCIIYRKKGIETDALLRFWGYSFSVKKPKESSDWMTRSR